jgi:hypothetical protein
VVNTAYLILGPGVEDSDLSNNQATAVLGPPLQIVFRDDFESGDLSAWSFQTGRGLEVAPEASLQGRYGLAVSPRVAGSAVVRDDSPTGESDYHAHFLFQPERTGSPAVGGLRGAHAATLFSGRAGSSPVSLFQVLLERKEHSLALRARARLDDGTLRESVSVPITAARHLIEVAWRRSGGPAVNDGQLLLRLDGKDAALLASLDNDAGGGVDSVELGLADAGRPFFAGRRGGVRLDAFLSWRPN